MAVVSVKQAWTGYCEVLIKVPSSSAGLARSDTIDVGALMHSVRS